MDKKALYSISYGIYFLSVKSGDKVNACITNTCMQASSDPLRLAICVINTNYTAELLKESRVFSITMLSKKCPFDTIKHFGMQSGRNVDKLGGLDLPKDINGLPYLGWCGCSVISCHVTESRDLGSHTMFIAEIDDAVKLSSEEPMTYAYYQSDVKPKPEAPAPEKKITGWRCKICGYVYEGEKLPEDFLCPWCGHDASDFEPIYS